MGDLAKPHSASPGFGFGDEVPERGRSRSAFHISECSTLIHISVGGGSLGSLFIDQPSAERVSETKGTEILDNHI